MKVLKHLLFTAFLVYKGQEITRVVGWNGLPCKKQRIDLYSLDIHTACWRQRYVETIMIHDTIDLSLFRLLARWLVTLALTQYGIK